MVVAVGEASKYFNGIIKTNETGAFFWKELEQGITENELVDKMLERFTDLDRETAKADLEEFIKGIAFAVDMN